MATTRTCCDDKNDKISVNVNDNHDDYRIALYYAYIELTPSEIRSHISIQKQVCDTLNLKGRIRISKEGVNGVLSGELTLLQKYEELISKNIEQIIVVNNDNNNKSSTHISNKKRFISSAVNDDLKDDDDYDININTEDTNIDSDDIIHTPTTPTTPTTITPAIIALDVKYCQLRKELPIQDQLFDRLLIKETKTVISLFDQSFEKKKESKKDRYRRRRECKHEEQKQMLLLRRKQNNSNTTDTTTTNNNDNDNDNSTDHNYQQQKQQKQQQQQCVDRDNDDGIDFNNHNNSDYYNNKKDTTTPIINKKEDEKKSIEIKSSSPYLDLQSLHNAVMEESLKPARHLSANEWNIKLDEAGLSSSNSKSSSALLLDVRNVYEMRVGHFVHPTTPTLLTNTRKYSDLPQLIATNQEIKEREQIFMYCTGGVRCERVSMLVRELYPDKQIYQLRGGIQKYIQTCSEQQEEEQQQQQQQQQEDSIDSKVENENNTATTTNSYFAGKNFVSLCTIRDDVMLFICLSISIKVLKRKNY
jgi:predicted sulfurtransferase